MLDAEWYKKNREFLELHIEWQIEGYGRSEEQIVEFWPDAENVEYDEVSEIVYNSRFQKPEWYEGEE